MQLTDKAHAARDEGRSKPHREFCDRVDNTDKYMLGDQKPDRFKTAENKYRDPYIVTNLIADIADRSASLTGTGQFEISIGQPPWVPEAIVNMKRDQFYNWYRAAHVEERVHQLARNAAIYGFGFLRMYVDSTRVPDLGGFIGVEVPNPRQVWLHPMARDPIERLMGSPYVGYETLSPARNVIARYPDMERALSRLVNPKVPMPGYDDETDPVAHLTQPYEPAEGERNEGEGGWNASSRATPVIGAAGANWDSYIRRTEYQWNTIEPIKINGEWMERTVWWMSQFAGEWNDPDGPILLDTYPILYGQPTIVCASAWERSDSPYSSGLIDKLGDQQDAYNMTMSSVVKIVQTDARYRTILMVREGALDPEQEEQIERGDPPDLIKVGAEGAFEDAPIGELFGRLNFQDVDFSKKLALLDYILGQMRNVSGIHQPVVGELSPSSRQSALAMQEARRTVSAAQETLREHIGSSVKYLGELASAMIDTHWIVEHELPAIGNSGGQVVNKQLPVTPERVAMLQQMLATGQKELKTQDGQTFIPTTIHVLRTTDSGYEEEVIDLDDQEAIDSIEQQQGVETVNVGFNYLPAFNLNVTLELLADYSERRQEEKDTLIVMERTKVGSVSYETWVRTFMKDMPGWTFEREIRNRMGDQFTELWLKLQQGSPELLQQAVQMIEQLQQQGLTPLGIQGAGTGQLPQTAAALPSPATAPIGR